jgi:mRNA interferase MazF
MSSRQIVRGDVFLADLSPVKGSEQGGTRPVIIISNNYSNAHSTTVIIAPVTGQKKQRQASHVALIRIPFLDKDSLALLEQPRTIDQVRLQRFLGHLNNGIMSRVNAALGVSVNLPRDRRDTMITLCPDCAAMFYKSKAFHIRRMNRRQRAECDCDFCGKKTGYAYLIRKKSKNGC